MNMPIPRGDPTDPENYKSNTFRVPLVDPLAEYRSHIVPLKASEPSGSTQVGGQHYVSLGVQPWAAFESWLGRDGFVGYLRGTIFKYLIRYQDKGHVEDLKKAQHVLAKLIETESTGDSSGLGPLGWKQTYNK